MKCSTCQTTADTRSARKAHVLATGHEAFVPTAEAIARYEERVAEAEAAGPRTYYAPTSAEIRWFRRRDRTAALAEIARLVERVERGYPAAPAPAIELDLVALLEGGPGAVGRRARPLIVVPPGARARASGRPRFLTASCRFAGAHRDGRPFCGAPASPDSALCRRHREIVRKHVARGY